MRYNKHIITKVVSESQLWNTEMFRFVEAVSETVDTIKAVYRVKPLIFIGAMLLSSSRLFLTLYLT